MCRRKQPSSQPVSPGSPDPVTDANQARGSRIRDVAERESALMRDPGAGGPVPRRGARAAMSPLCAGMPDRLSSPLRGGGRRWGWFRTKWCGASCTTPKPNPSRQGGGDTRIAPPNVRVPSGARPMGTICGPAGSRRRVTRHPFEHFGFSCVIARRSRGNPVRDISEKVALWIASAPPRDDGSGHGPKCSTGNR